MGATEREERGVGRCRNWELAGDRPVERLESLARSSYCTCVGV